MDAATATPATAAQLRALHAGFGALGYRGLAGRPARLAAASAVLGLDEKLTSFSELSAGQAGLLQAALRRGEIAPAREHQVRPVSRESSGTANQVSHAASDGDLLAITDKAANAAAWLGLALYLVVRSRRIEMATVGR